MSERSSQRSWGEAVASDVVRGALAHNVVVREIHHSEVAASTQDLLDELARAGAASGTVALVDLQHAGRGRSGNRWDDDPRGGSLALSLLLDVTAPPSHPASLPLVPHALGLAVLDACSALGRGASSLRLKWPNDVVFREAEDRPARKLAGVLVERDRIVGPGGPREVLRCGIGLNVALSSPLLADRIDLATVLGLRPDSATLLGALLTALDRAILSLASPATLLDRLHSVSDTVGRVVRVTIPTEGAIVGIATGIDGSGRLLVSTAGTTRAIVSGTLRYPDQEPGDVSTDEGGRTG